NRDALFLSGNGKSKAAEFASGLIFPIFKVIRLQKLAMRIQMREHSVKRGIHQLLVGNGISIDVILANQLHSSREAGDRCIVNPVIVCFGTGTQYSDPDPQVQEDAKTKKAVKNLALHANATLARLRLEPPDH